MRLLTLVATNIFICICSMWLAALWSCCCCSLAYWLASISSACMTSRWNASGSLTSLSASCKLLFHRLFHVGLISLYSRSVQVICPTVHCHTPTARELRERERDAPITLFPLSHTPLSVGAYRAVHTLCVPHILLHSLLTSLSNIFPWSGWRFSVSQSKKTHPHLVS